MMRGGRKKKCCSVVHGQHDIATSFFLQFYCILLAKQGKQEKEKCTNVRNSPGEQERGSRFCRHYCVSVAFFPCVWEHNQILIGEEVNFFHSNGLWRWWCWVFLRCCFFFFLHVFQEWLFCLRRSSRSKFVVALNGVLKRAHCTEAFPTFGRREMLELLFHGWWCGVCLGFFLGGGVVVVLFLNLHFEKLWFGFVVVRALE